MSVAISTGASMSNSRSLSNLVADYLRASAGERLKVEAIANGLVSTYPGRFAKKQESLGGSRDDLITQLTREIYAQRNALLKNHPDISADTSRRPLRLFVEDAALSKAAIIQVAPPNEAAPIQLEAPAVVTATEQRDEQTEQSLYIPLQKFLDTEINVVSRRIRESTSSNRRGKNGNKWLHPDIAGMLAPGQAWNDVVRQCATELPTRKAKLISVEVKIRLTGSDVREAFFQTVSNSLWANRAYLAAVEIKGDETLRELETLCSLHGVGFISIDPDEVAESRIVIPAREREEVDWASVNRIAEENDDFRSYLKDVLNYLRTGRVVTSLWEHAQDKP